MQQLETSHAAKKHGGQREVQSARKANDEHDQLFGDEIARQ